MKKILTYALISVSILGFTSCAKFLAENPKSYLTGVDYYETETQIRQNVNYLYRTGAPNVMTSAGSAYVGPFVSINSMLTGYYSNSYEGQETVCQYARLLTRQNYTTLCSTTMDNVWDACYRAINVANGSIQAIPDITFNNYDPDQLMGEAKFFRAFNYFLLVKTFGAVPLFTSYIEALSDDVYAERTSADEIYALIEDDLEYAMANLPATKFYSNSCLISKPVAAMVLADVYMQEGKYSQALTPLQYLVNESGHALLTNDDQGENSAYNKLRSTDGSNEVIYSYEYNSSVSTGGWWPTYSFDSKAVTIFSTYAIFERVCGPTARYLNVYSADDLRGQNQQFFCWDYTNPVTGSTWAPNNDEDGNALPGVWYWYDEDALLNSGYSTKDRDFYRYAEAVLDYAECLAQTGSTAQAVDYLAQIKSRAGLDTSSLSSLSQTELIQECWTERLREFPAEFKIWDQCTRTGMFPNISETEKGVVTYETLVGAKNGSGATFKSSDLLWPISLNAMQRNPNLTQNDGYQSNL